MMMIYISQPEILTHPSSIFSRGIFDWLQRKILEVFPKSFFKKIRVSIKRGKGKTSKSRRKKFEESKLDIYVWQTLQEMLIESTAISFYNQSCQFLCKHKESALEQICTRNLHKITANLTLSFQSSNLMVLCGSSFPNESCFLMKDCFVRVHDFFNSM